MKTGRNETPTPAVNHSSSRHQFPGSTKKIKVTKSQSASTFILTESCQALAWLVTKETAIQGGQHSRNSSIYQHWPNSPSWEQKQLASLPSVDRGRARPVLGTASIGVCRLRPRLACTGCGGVCARMWGTLTWAPTVCLTHCVSKWESQTLCRRTQWFTFTNINASPLDFTPKLLLSIVGVWGSGGRGTCTFHSPLGFCRVRITAGESGGNDVWLHGRSPEARVRKRWLGSTFCLSAYGSLLDPDVVLRGCALSLSEPVSSLFSCLLNSGQSALSLMISLEPPINSKFCLKGLRMGLTWI
jgi:hypothetical protein